MAVAREIAVPVERLVDTASAGFAGAMHGVMWRFLPVNAPIAILSTSGVGIGSLMGSIWTRGMASAVLGGMASGSAAVLGFVAPLLLGAGTARRTGARRDQGRADIINTKALPGPAGEKVRENITDFIELGALA